MLEVLVTMTISAVAVMGAAMLTLQAMKLNQGGRYRAQAVLLSADLAERIEANKDGAIEGRYALAANAEASAAKDCSAAVCTAAELSAHDLAQWTADVATVLPGASWTVTQVDATNPVTYQIVVGWTDRGSGAGANGSTATEQFSYTTQKTVYR